MLSDAQQIHLSEMLKQSDIEKERRQEEMEKISGQIKVCIKCRLHKTRKVAVPGEGPIGAEYFIVGQGPGANEDITGRPFIGRAGKLLTQLLELAGIERESNTFITSIVKCFPTPPPNRKPLSDEVAACNPYLIAQINLVRPKKIIILGDCALKVFFPDKSLKDWRGKWLEKDGLKYFVSYHPAAGIRFQKMKKILEQDFKNLRRPS